MEARLIDRLPMLPGYSLPEVKERYPLCHTFDFRSGMPVARSLPASVSSMQRQQHGPPRQPPFEVDEGALLGGGASWGHQSSDDDNGTRTHHRRRRPVASKDNFLPNFALNDKKVLHFQGYFREEVDNSPFEQYRVRPVDIFYFLEDDSVSVREPKQENSGLSQGCIVRRHRIRKPDGNCFHWSDFNVGNDISLYGVTYRVINCDKFTREYLRQRGVCVRGPELLPEDPYTVARRSLSQQQRKQHTTKSQRDKLWRFLRYDRHVLRFFCVEDGAVDPRHRKKLVLQYFLVDDTLDLKELHRPLEQRELAPILLGRQRVPKLQESRGLFHVYETDGEGEDYIGPEDLLPGRRLNLYGRSFLIYDCDDFTKNFYRENFGTDNFDVIDVGVREEERPQQPIPPHNGFGSPEDTLQSVFRITPRRVRRDSRQVLEKEGIVLRFQATLDSAVPLDKERSFVVCFYPSDETVSILERPLPNSGMPGGKFLRRMRLRKPAQLGTVEPRYYDLSDFRVGNVLEVVGRRFVLVRADQFAASYIKRHQLDTLPNGTGTTDNLTVNGNHRPSDRSSDNQRMRQESRLS